MPRARTIRLLLRQSGLALAMVMPGLPGVALGCPQPPADLVVQPMYAQPGRHEVLTEGIWAVWFDPAFFDPTDARTVAERLGSARCAALTSYGMREAPNVAAGVYFNVYLHVPGEDDGFGGRGWENGVGTDDANLPFMTLPQGAHADPTNLDHEGFHVFQYDAVSPGYINDGDSGWYIETSAQWFMAERTPDQADIYTTASAIAGTPHLAMWHGFYNAEKLDPVHWMTETRQYGMHLFIRHLGAEWGLADGLVTAGYFDGTALTPQEYLSQRLGHEAFATAWGDFAALMTASFLFGPGAPMPDWTLLPAQRDYALTERARVMATEPMRGVEDDIATVAKIGGDWAGPPDRLRPRPWSYNVVRVVDPAGTPVFIFDADAPAQMTLRLVVRRGDTWDITPLLPGQEMDLTKALDAFVVVAWTPPLFHGATTTDYRIRIERERLSSE